MLHAVHVSHHFSPFQLAQIPRNSTNWRRNLLSLVQCHYKINDAYVPSMQTKTVYRRHLKLFPSSGCVFKCISDGPPKWLLYLNFEKEDASCFQQNHCFWFCFCSPKMIQKMSMGKQMKPTVSGEWRRNGILCALLTFCLFSECC